MWGEHMMGGSGWGVGLFWLLVLAASVALVISAMRWNDRGQADVMQSRSALRMLEERYVRGEIGKEEFEQKRRDLRS